MSEVLPSGCQCPTPVTVEVPGSAGATGNPGADGADGTNGTNAYSTITNAFVIPNVGVNVTVDVNNSSWMAFGQVVVASDGGGNIGHFSVANTGSSTSATLTFLGYSGDSAPSTTINNSFDLGKISPSGIQPPTAGFVKLTIINYGTTTFTPQATTNMLIVECVGGGGSGGGVGTAATNSGAAGGGGSGAYSVKTIATPLSSSYTCQVGAGGAAPSAGANNGNAGDDTTFGSPSVCTAKGGGGGYADTVATIHAGGLGGAGGDAASGTGDELFDGNDGGAGIALAAAQAVSGFGAGSYVGGQTAGIKTQGNGTAGQRYGGGGAGGCIVSGGANVAGGVGGNGVIRVWEFAT